MDRGSEYTSEWIRQTLKSRGVKLIYTTVADSRGNGVAERLNRTLLDRCQIDLLIPIYKNGPEGITGKEFYEQVGEWLHKAQDKLNSNSQEENNEPEFTTETHKHHTIQTQKVRKLQQKNSQPHKHLNDDSNPLQYTYTLLDI
ncbi:transposon Ty2-LR1 Gag-Pol polyprotein [Kluyveromyces marxianus]|uniref:Transposon Ty2-LR1 Gag-Pol polyprotein n=1 Tax=Kluyveromyces marxianus TaxID=4911 RepID=A0ABX6EPW9_KLUMA|nr:transposon Ty2-LR1 Gag-Pol polyprotein [Kluyveromyces marxianus]